MLLSGYSEKFIGLLMSYSVSVNRSSICRIKCIFINFSREINLDFLSIKNVIFINDVFILPYLHEKISEIAPR
jgi:hypothetical protein